MSPRGPDWALGLLPRALMRLAGGGDGGGTDRSGGHDRREVGDPLPPSPHRIIGRRFIFGRSDRPTPQPAPVQQLAVRDEDVESPAPRSAAPRAAAPLESSVRGLFARLNLDLENASPAAAKTPATSSPRAKGKYRPPQCFSPAPHCCICLDDIAPAKHAGAAKELRCPRCTMVAHPGCLRRWFGTEKGSATPRPTASCPNCRAELNWDFLALQSRRRQRVPLGLMMASDAALIGKATDEAVRAMRLGEDVTVG